MTATYRLQLAPDFTFADAELIVPYLAELGITHLYLSPILQPAAGSTHGYDVVDPERVNAALGGEAGFRSLVAAVRALGMQILLDIVPNHMSTAAGNPWWRDVLENGQASYYAHFFDVDWPSGEDRVTLPVLAERYGRMLTGGQLGVMHDGAGRFAVRAGELRLPIAPRAVGRIVARAGERVGNAELAYLGDALAALPRDLRAEARRRRHRDKAVLLARLAELCRERAWAAAVDAEVAAIAKDPAEVDAILELQAYRLVHWSVSASGLTYRRFFDISSLVGLRNEEPDVFEASHARILGWLADGWITGVRIDHVDGLRDPGAYLARLREHASEAWIVVEKILGPGERLPSWPIDGTTGYEYADRITGLLVDPAAEQALTAAFESYTGQTWDPAAASRAARRELMADSLHSELSRLVELGCRACAVSPTCRDYTRGEIEDALAELFAGYPVYRTYGGDEIDRRRIAAAARSAQGIDRDLLAFLAASLGFEVASAEAQELAKSAQQLTGAIIAKGDEDTLGYRQVRLAARCEVGSDLAAFARPPVAVHRALADTPMRSLLATTTHDTKRGEDVRARIAVLSEVPDAWSAAVVRWRVRADRHWGETEPDRTVEYLIWQTLVGAWPISADRITAYARKAAREARLRTTWRKPDEAYEAALDRWCRGVLADRELVAEIEHFVAALAPRAAANALAQLLVKLTAPGVPDIYQGCELADGSLVDPDNRRPVDYIERRAKLRAIADARVEAIAGDLGLAKLWTIRRVLALRRRRPELFAEAYEPLAAVGPHAERVFAFARGGDLIAVVPRLGPIDRHTALELPVGRWTDVLSDRSHTGKVSAAELWAKLPVALLVLTG